MSIQENRAFLQQAIAEGRESVEYKYVQPNLDLPFQLRSMPSIELVASQINDEDFFNTLKALPAEEVKPMAYKRALVSLWTRFRAICQQSGLDDQRSSALADTTVETFEDNDKFVEWAKEKMPSVLNFQREYHPYFGRLGYTNIVTGKGFVTKIYGRTLAETLMQTLSVEYTGHVMNLETTEVTFIDCWVAAQHFPDFKTMEARIQSYADSLRHADPRKDVDITQDVVDALKEKEARDLQNESA